MAYYRAFLLGFVAGLVILVATTRITFEECLETCEGDIWAWSPASCECGCP